MTQYSMRKLLGTAWSHGGRTFFVVFLTFGLTGAIARGQEPGQPREATPPANGQPSTIKDILNLDIEQLGKVDVTTPSMNLEVTSVSKQESTVGRSPAAIYVITSEMIARSPANNIPDLLRMVPGLEVARIDAHTWAITARGFNNRYSSDLLVLIDGRTVYSTLTAGVWWDVQDVLLEDIERIEVIRGPGSTVWGANAVNGVINIITKKAEDTQGALVTYGGGDEDRGLGGFRTGSTIGEDIHYRIYGKHREEAPGFNPDGPAPDDWRQGRAGFRAEWVPGRDKADVLTVQGDYYVGTDGDFGIAALPVDPYQTLFTVDESVEGGNVLSRWTHVFNEDSDYSVQTYYDRMWRKTPGMWNLYTNTFDVEFQNRFSLGDRHKIIWGSDYRQVHSKWTGNGFDIAFNPTDRTTSLFSMFGQDEVTLVEDRWFFTVGSKFEHNDFSGFEFQPSGRLLFTPDKKHSFWAAITRAVRTPVVSEQDLQQLTFPPIPDPPSQYFQRIEGNPNCHSENLMAYELGFRAQPEKEYSYDVALFYNAYEEGFGMVPQEPYTDEYGNYIVPYQFGNTARAQTYGAELAGQWTPSERWRLNASYTYLYMHIYAAPGTMAYVSPGSSPNNQMKVASSWDLGLNWQFDLDLRYVDYLPDLGVPSYITMDARLAWRPNKRLEVALYGRNLLDNHHLEFVESPQIFFYGTEVARSVFGKVTWRY